MKNVLEYVYYRIARFYKASGDKDYLEWGYWILFDSFGCIALTIINLLLYAFHSLLSKRILIAVFVLVGILNVAAVIFLDGNRKLKKYEALEERYINERHRCLKGWAIFLSLISTLVMAIIVGIACHANY